MSNKKPQFIVFEGLDGAGTTTQAHKLHAYFTNQGANSFLTYEPTADPIGSLIRDILTRAAKKDGQTYEVSQRAMTMLFSADRLAHTTEIEAQRKVARVICDRYVYSTLAYQTLDPSIDPEWVASLNSECAKPDLTIFLSVPVGVCLDRIGARSEDRSVFERRDLLETIAGNYARLQDLYASHFGPLVTIDGTQSPEAVHEEAISLVD